MSDKYLTVKQWQKFAAERAYKDSPAAKAMVKALGAAERAVDSPPAEQLKVLDELEAAGRELLKLHKGDKKLESYLEDVYKPLKKYRKDAETIRAEAARAKSDQDGAPAPKSVADAVDAADDDDGPAWRDPRRLLRHLNACRTDPALRLQFAYVDGADKAPGLMAASSKLAAATMFRKMVAETGVKTGTFGTAWVDGTALMLQPDKPPGGGLARRLRPVVNACGFKIARIVIVDADGLMFEQDDAAEGATAATGGAAPRGAVPPAPPIPPPRAAAPAAAPGPPSAVFAARLKAMLPKLAELAGTREGQAAKLLASEAGVMARKAEFADALRQLDKVEVLLARAAGQAAPPDGAKAAAAGAPVADWATAVQTWQDAYDTVNDQLVDLRLAIVEWLDSDDPEVETHGQALRDIAEHGLGSLTQGRRVKLMAALVPLRAGTPEALRIGGGRALTAIREFESFVAQSPEVAATDDNPFGVTVSIRSTLLPALRVMAEVLESAAAA